MHVLLLGAGGREHALAWKLAQSPRLTRLSAAPGNPGIAKHARLVPLDVADHAAVAAFCKREEVGLVAVGPETPLAAGIADDLAAKGIAVFGPSRAAAQLEASKGFTKDLCAEAGIPTARYARFRDPASATAFVRHHDLPIVIKADGLAAGKGVTVAATVEEAVAAVWACFSGAFGAAGAEVVVEACLTGEEASFFALSDGKTVVPLATAQDYKRAYDGDEGPNTGGMGACSPAPAMTGALIARTMDTIITPTVKAMARRGTPFVGILYAGLMLTDRGPQLIEYNVRFGDPEAQVLMPRLTSDLLELMLATVEGRLAGVTPQWSEDAALTVVLAAGGYPGRYTTGHAIRGIEQAEAVPGVQVFHAGTALHDGQLVSAGGRVLNVTARGTTIAEAKARAYLAAGLIGLPGGFYRHDIGWRAIAR